MSNPTVKECHVLVDIIARPPDRSSVSIVARRALRHGLSVVTLCVLLSGCVSSSQLVPTQPSAITQQLVLRSLERALMQLDTTRFEGRTVSVDLLTQTGSGQAFVEEFVIAWFRAHRIRVAAEPQDLKLSVFASVLGTDRGESFFGIPSIQTPLIGVPTPEIALFKWVRNRGLAEISIYGFDATTSAFVGTVGPGIGHSKQDDFTILIVINFTLSDADKRPPGDRTDSDRR